MPQPTIEIRNLNKTYYLGHEPLHVLKNINFRVEKGEFVAILGPSGSGKSTLMNVLGCIDVADDGEYFLDGAPVHNLKDNQLTQLRNQHIGFIFQNYNLIPTYTVVQNIVAPLLMRGMSYREAEAQSQSTIEMLGLTERRRHKPTELSGGQQQRVSVARALVGSPSVLLADEPTGALDSHTGEEVLKLFRKLNDLGNTIIMITHSIEVASIASRIVHIIDGELSEA
jgi:putative ABC transport system ATP-binding protein